MPRKPNGRVPAAIQRAYEVYTDKANYSFRQMESLAESLDRVGLSKAAEEIRFEMSSMGFELRKLGAELSGDASG